jgi:hypothetical protein
VKKDQMDTECSTNGKKLKACRILVRIPEGKRSLGRPKLDVREKDGVLWAGLIRREALVNTVMNIWVP